MSLSNRNELSAMALLEDAMIHHKAGEWETAIRLFHQVIEKCVIEKNQAVAEACHQVLGLTYSGNNDWRRAAFNYSIAAKFCEKNQKSAQAIIFYIQAIKAFDQLNKPTEAINLEIARCCRQAVALMGNEKEEKKDWKEIAEYQGKLYTINAALNVAKNVSRVTVAQAYQMAGGQYVLDGDYDSAMSAYASAEKFYESKDEMHQADLCRGDFNIAQELKRKNIRLTQSPALVARPGGEVPIVSLGHTMSQSFHYRAKSVVAAADTNKPSIGLSRSA
jgi:tetratricopeptide (TPR) repeat protein